MKIQYHLFFIGSIILLFPKVASAKTDLNFSLTPALSTLSWEKAQEDGRLKNLAMVRSFLRRPEILTIFKVMGHNVNEKNTLGEIHALSQKHFLRPKVERWAVPLTFRSIFESKRPLLLPLLKKAGFFGEVKPTLKHYDFILIFGALLRRMGTRTQYLQEIWQEGVRASHVIYLTGKRPLVEEEEDISFYRKDDDIQKVLYESDLPPLVWEKHIQSPDLKKLSFYTIHVPKMIDPLTKKERRPNTNDTLKAFIHKFKLTDPYRKPVRILAISNNPYVFYQGITLETAFLKEGSLKPGDVLETVGHGAEEEDIEMYLPLDSLARVLHTILSIETPPVSQYKKGKS